VPPAKNLPRIARAWRGIASRQETYVQNSNPCQNDFPQRFIDHAFARVMERLASERQSADPDPIASGRGTHEGERTVEPLLDGADLLRVIREPVEWLLTLAHRLAASDPVDIAAVDRVRAAFHARLAGRSIGVRTTDLLIVFGLLVGALDPSVVLRTVSETLGDGLAAVLGSEASLAIHVSGTADASAALRPRRTCVPSSRGARSSRSHLMP
jgi:hypothetical protein